MNVTHAIIDDTINRLNEASIGIVEIKQITDTMIQIVKRRNNNIIDTYIMNFDIRESSLRISTKRRENTHTNFSHTRPRNTSSTLDLDHPDTDPYQTVLDHLKELT
jgi:hypothetical protein